MRKLLGFYLFYVLKYQEKNQAFQNQPSSSVEVVVMYLIIYLLCSLY